jgi:hypothetical protein
MPAGLPGSSAAQNAGNPTAGRFVIFDPLSGPKGSPFDRAGSAVASTGGMCTGIGQQPQPVIGAGGIPPSWVDDQIAGTVTVGAAASKWGVDGGYVKNDVRSEMLYIGGGKSVAGGAPVPYTAGIQILGAGEGGSRDAGAGPAFTGFGLKMVTAVGSVANGAAIEAGFVNRTGVTMVAGQSSHGSTAAATNAPA